MHPISTALPEQQAGLTIPPPLVPSWMDQRQLCESWPSAITTMNGDAVHVCIERKCKSWVAINIIYTPMLVLQVADPAGSSTRRAFTTKHFSNIIRLALLHSIAKGQSYNVLSQV